MEDYVLHIPPAVAAEWVVRGGTITWYVRDQWAVAHSCPLTRADAERLWGSKPDAHTAEAVAEGSADPEVLDFILQHDRRTGVLKAALRNPHCAVSSVAQALARKVVSGHIDLRHLAREAVLARGTAADLKAAGLQRGVSPVRLVELLEAGLDLDDFMEGAVIPSWPSRPLEFATFTPEQWRSYFEAADTAGIQVAPIFFRGDVADTRDLQVVHDAVRMAVRPGANQDVWEAFLQQTQWLAEEWKRFRALPGLGSITPPEEAIVDLETWARIQPVLVSSPNRICGEDRNWWVSRRRPLLRPTPEALDQYRDRHPLIAFSDLSGGGAASELSDVFSDWFRNSPPLPEGVIYRLLSDIQNDALAYEAFCGAIDAIIVNLRKGWECGRYKSVDRVVATFHAWSGPRVLPTEALQKVQNAWGEFLRQLPAERVLNDLQVFASTVLFDWEITHRVLGERVTEEGMAELAVWLVRKTTQPQALSREVLTSLRPADWQILAMDPPFALVTAWTREDRRDVVIPSLLNALHDMGRADDYNRISAVLARDASSDISTAVSSGVIRGPMIQTAMRVRGKDMAKYAEEKLGDNYQKWSMFWELAADWPGTYLDLLSTADLLASE